MMSVQNKQQNDLMLAFFLSNREELKYVPVVTVMSTKTGKKLGIKTLLLVVK